MKIMKKIRFCSFILLLSIYSTSGRHQITPRDVAGEPAGATGGPTAPMSPCDQPKEGLKRTGLKSKYFYDAGKPVNFDQVKASCENKNLKVAEITSQADVDHLTKFVETLTPGSYNFLLDYTMKSDGTYSSGSGKPMEFQNFEPGTDLDKGKSCVVIHFLNPETPKMMQWKCEEAAAALCQYKENDACLHNSAQEANKAEDELKEIGVVEEAHFYSSPTKKTKKDAEAFCEGKSSHLLMIKSQKVNEKVYIMAKEFATSQNVDPRTEFWTSGSATTGKNASIQWGADGDLIKDSVNYKLEEGPPTSATGCLTYSADPPAGVGGKVVSTFHKKNCDLPQYFICYMGVQPDDFADSKDMEAKMNETTTEAPEEGPAETEPTTTLPPFFANKNITVTVPPRREEPEDPAPKPPKPSCYKISELPSITATPNDTMSKEDLMNLIKFARNSHIEENGIDIPYKGDSQWRKELVMLLAKIFLKVCPAAIVPTEYINTIIVLASVYLNSLEADGVATKIGQPVWDELISPLRDCEGSTTSLTISSKGMFANEWLILEENRINRILVPRELVDGYIPLNTVIDHFWTIYGLSMGNCMAMADSPSNWAAQYYRSFTKDFMEPLMKAWTTPPSFDIGVLIGDFDLETMNYNLRACTTAAFMRSGIADRQLVRPMDLAQPHGEQFVNEKTGKPVMNVLT